VTHANRTPPSRARAIICRDAGISDDVGFATKPELARQMIARALDGGVRFAWVTGDEAYGQNPGLRDWLEDQELAYVMAVPKTFTVAAGSGPLTAAALAALVPRSGWQRLSCGDGAKGPRLYDWALIGTTSPAHYLLVRRSLTPDAKGVRELAFFTCYAPGGAPLTELVRVAGSRWAIEECFQAAKNETGLDHYQVRLYQAWYRHATLSMLALAFLAITAQKGAQPLWTTFPAGHQHS
jgi:SRSO17 transposase